jgi:hypothetical protein
MAMGIAGSSWHSQTLKSDKSSKLRVSDTEANDPGQQSGCGAKSSTNSAPAAIHGFLGSPRFANCNKEIIWWSWKVDLEALAGAKM